MLIADNLTISHRRDLRILIESLSFVLNPGDKLAVIGEEGNGKSSLLKVLAARDMPPDYLDVTGAVSGSDRIGYLAQFISPEDLGRSVYDYVTAGSDSDWQAINDAALRLRLAPEFLYESRRLGSLSGGERTKVQFCRLLIQKPDVMLLDEPSNDLDIPTLEWLERFISEEERPLLFVSHDETLVERTASGILHLEQLHRRQTPVWTLARTGLPAYMAERDAAFSRQSRLALADERQHEARMERYRRIEQQVEHDQASISRQDPAGGRLLKKKMHAVKSLGRRLDKTYEERTKKPDREDAVLLFADPAISHPRDKRILDLALPVLRVPDGSRILARDIDLTVRGREKVAIIGSNGCGKSTLLRRIYAELSVRQDLRVAYMPQNYEDVLPAEALPVEFLAPSGHVADRQRALDMLGCMKFDRHEMMHRIEALSGGQKAKLFMLSFLLQEADTWLLDEPTRNFSPLSAPVVREVLSAFNGTIISVSHDRRYLAEVATRCYELNETGLRLIEEAGNV